MTRHKTDFVEWSIISARHTTEQTSLRARSIKHHCSMISHCIVWSLFVLFISVTETLGSQEILDDMLDEITTIKRDMNKMKSDLDDRLDKLLHQVEDLRVIQHEPKTTNLTSPTLPPQTLPPQPTACSSYTELSEAWRHIDYVNRGEFFAYCDKTDDSGWITHTNLAWGSWFRFTGAAGTKLPTAPAPVAGPSSTGNRICGTAAVAWLKGDNPTIQDGIVTRDVCFEWLSKSCDDPTTVRVAACRDIHGDYFVYQLKAAPACPNAYCAID